MRGERIEWEAIARRKHQIARVTRGGLASTAEERELEYIDVLEAGEAMAATVKRVAAALDLVTHSRQAVALDLAVKDWRRCVAPRGEGA